MANEIDDVTAQAILASQLQDLEELEGLYRNEGQLTDGDVALHLYRQELRRFAVSLRDHRIGTLYGESPSTNDQLPELQPDVDPLLQLHVLVHDALNPRSINGRRHHDSLEASHSRVEPGTQYHTTVGDNDREQNTKRTQRSSYDGLPGAVPSGYPCKRRRLGFGEGQYSKISCSLEDRNVNDPVSERQQPAQSELQGVCIVCQDRFQQRKLLHLACGHDYCHECMVALFNNAMKDESLFPPRCRKQVVPLAMVQRHFAPGFSKTFRKRQVEMNTPNRTYCCTKSCSVFIEPSNIEGDKATCPDCKIQTCIICKGCAHQGDCPEDPAMISLMATAAQEGYKQCPSCRLLVELTFGCNHMTYVIIDNQQEYNHIDHDPDVGAEHSSVTSVESPGRIALAHSSIRSAS
ncbi:MAG: hypothetical protein Q9213_008274 [Squamulea squamosa]